MMQEHMSLREMADELNREGVLRPKGAGPWTPASVRWTFVTS